MCTFNLTLSDSLIEAVRPTFKTREDVSQWLQKQAAFWLQQIASQQEANEAKKRINDISVFDCFSGDFGGDRDAHEIAEELHDSRLFNRNVTAL